MLCGLPELPTNEITEHLKTHNNVNVTKIILLNSTGSFKRYILHFDPKENTKADIKNIRTILNHMVKWLPAKPANRGPTQCLRCGMFGHGISACHRIPNCFLCGEKHETAKCTFNGEGNDQRVFKCHNCKIRNLPHNHRANDPLCPSRIKYIEIESNANQKNAHGAVSHYTHSNSSFPPLPAHAPPPLTHTFAEAAKQQQRRPSRAHTSNHTRSEPIDGELFTFAEISDILLNCVNDLARCTTKIDQLRVIALMLNNAFK